MSTIDQIREREAQGERQTCVRTLLQNPLLQAVGQHGDLRIARGRRLDLSLRAGQRTVSSS